MSSFCWFLLLAWCAGPVRPLYFSLCYRARNASLFAVHWLGCTGDVTRRAFTYLVMGTAGVTYAAAAKVVVRDFLDTMNASADVLAMANVEINIGSMAEGTGEEEAALCRGS